MDAQRKARTRKPKVAPVIGSQVKLDKMLKKQMQAMTITNSGGANKSQAAAAKKLNMADASSSDDGEEAMQGVTRAAAVPRLAASSKNRISKHKDGISRAREVSLKKEIKRRKKMGTKESRK